MRGALWAGGVLGLGCEGIDGRAPAGTFEREATLRADVVADPGPPEPASAPASSSLQQAPSWLEQCPEPRAAWQPADTGGPEGESVLGCLRRLGSAVDDRIPFDQQYELTTFGGPGDEQPTQCLEAPDADGTWFYAANRQRFGCGARARLVDPARTRCAIVQVADLGPNICVEEAAEAPAWDVSPLVSRHLFGVPQAGWSENRRVLGAPVASDTPLGPCDEHLHNGPRSSFIGDTCGSAEECDLPGSLCLDAAQGWAGGYCTQECTDSCPSRAGPYALAACAQMPDGSGRCLARCDFTLFENGCRDGYACLMAPHPDGQTESAVCAPARCG